MGSRKKSFRICETGLPNSASALPRDRAAFRAPNIVIAVKESQEFEHHQRVRPGEHALSALRFAGRQPPFQRILVRLGERDRAPGTGARMDPFLYIHAEVGGPLEFLRGHELDAHDFLAVRDGLFKWEKRIAIRLSPLFWWKRVGVEPIPIRSFI
jgi:hypothetical protein